MCWPFLALLSKPGGPRVSPETSGGSDSRLCPIVAACRGHFAVRHAQLGEQAIQLSANTRIISQGRTPGKPAAHISTK